MNFRSSRELGEGCLAVASSAIESSVMSNSTPTVKRSSKRGLQTASLILPRSSGTFESLSLVGQPESIAALRTWLAAAFPVNPSPLPESEREATTPAICGPHSETLSPPSNPATSSPRTSPDSLEVPLAILTETGWTKPQQSLFATSEPFSETWPRSGTVSDGRCWELTMLAPLTGARDCGFWVTPKASEEFGEHYTEETSLRHFQEGRQICLSQQVRNARMWPTPRASECAGGATGGPQLDRQIGLSAMVKLAGGPSTRPTYPTPRTPSPTGGGIGLDGGQRARAMEGYSPELGSAGQLNPAWVAWLMGWPINWESLAPLSAGAYRAWLWAFRTALTGCGHSGTDKSR
jgi:hypothetical protein